MEHFRTTGYLKPYKHGLFMIPSWVAVLIGQGIIPGSWHPAVNEWETEQLHATMEELKRRMKTAAAQLPDHMTALQRHCAAGNADAEPWPTAAMSLYSVFS
jgi:tryptophan halogenase